MRASGCILAGERGERGGGLKLFVNPYCKTRVVSNLEVTPFLVNVTRTAVSFISNAIIHIYKEVVSSSL